MDKIITHGVVFLRSLFPLCYWRKCLSIGRSFFAGVSGGSNIRGSLAIAFTLVLSLVLPKVSQADGAIQLYAPLQGCIDRTVAGVGLYADGQGSVSVNAPGTVIDAYIEWGGVEDATPATEGSSSLTINGASVVGTLVAEGVSGGWGNGDKYYTWNANIGPNGYDLLNQVGATNISISDWDGQGSSTYYEQSTWGATITVVYSTGNCSEQNQLQHLTGADFYYAQTALSQTLVFRVPNLPQATTASIALSHGGTDSVQAANVCLGGALWMSAGSGSEPSQSDPLYTRDGTGRAYGLQNSNGVVVNAVEVVNDPFTGTSLACVLSRNPAPDSAYANNHLYPSGASASPYRTLSNSPDTGGDLGPEWGVIDVEVSIPAHSDWVAFQLESEADEIGESGVWASAALSVKRVELNRSSIEVLQVLNNAPRNYNPNFSVEISCSDGTLTTLVLKSGVVQTVDEIQIGATCTISEPNLPAPPSAYSWTGASPTYNPSAVITVQAQAVGSLETQIASLDIGSNDVNAPVYSIALKANVSNVANVNRVTVTNTLLAASTATVKIIKNALPDSAEDFSFTATGFSPASFTLDDDNDSTLSNEVLYANLAPGQYRITELATVNWDLSHVHCQGAGLSLFSVDGSGVDIDLAAGEDVICTFTNAGACPTDANYFLNVAKVENSNGDSEPSNNLSSVCVELYGNKADLVIVMSLPGLPSGVASPTFTVSVDCTDNAFDANGILLTDGQKHLIRAVPVDTQCTVTEPTPLPAVGTGYSYGTTTYNPAQTVTMVGGGVEVTVINPVLFVDLSVTIVANKGTTVPGDILVYTVSMTNTGTAPALNAFALDTLASEVQFVSSNASSTGTNFNAATGRWDVGNLAAGATVVLEITVEVN